MKLLSVEYDYEYSNLVEAMKSIINYILIGFHLQKSSAASAGEYWTSGSDIGCEGAYGWCTVNKLIRDKESKWAAGEPDNKQNSEHCVSIAMNKTSGLLMDKDCSNKLKYICEARDTTKTSSSSEAMLDECGSAFNVSRGLISPNFNDCK